MKTRAVVALVILLSAAVAAGGVSPRVSSLSAESIKFSDPIKISSGVPASKPTITLAKDGSGNIYVAWVEGEPSEIVLRRAKIEIKDGKPEVVWEPALSEPPVNVSGTQTTKSRAPSLAADTRGTLFVVWEDDGGKEGKADIFLKSFTDKGETLLNLSENSGVSQKPAIAAGGPGDLFVVWADNTPNPETNPAGVSQILLRRLIASGEPIAITPSDTFVISLSPISPAAPAARPDDPAFSPAIAADDQGRSFVAWEVRAGGGVNPEIVFRNSTPYAPLINISKSPGRSQAPAIVIDQFGKVSVVWEGEEDRFGKSEILISSSLKDETGRQTAVTDFVIPKFSSPFNISGPNSPGTSREPAVAVDGTGTVFVVWSDDTAEDLVRTTGKFQIFFRRSDRAFEPPVRVSRRLEGGKDISGNAATPAIAVDGVGNIFVVWAEDNEVRFSAALKAR